MTQSGQQRVHHDILAHNYAPIAGAPLYDVAKERHCNMIERCDVTYMDAISERLKYTSIQPVKAKRKPPAEFRLDTRMIDLAW